MSFKERTDVTAVPAWASWPRRWSRSCSRPRRCASSAATRVDGVRAQRRRPSGPLRDADGLGRAPRARRADGRGQDDGRPAGRRTARPAVRRHRRGRRGVATGRRSARSSRPTASRRSASSRRRRMVDALAERPSRCDRRAPAASVLADREPRRAPARRRQSSCGSRADPTVLVDRASARRPPPAARRRPRAALEAMLPRPREPLYREVADRVVDTDEPEPRRRRRRDRRAGRRCAEHACTVTRAPRRPQPTTCVVGARRRRTSWPRCCRRGRRVAVVTQAGHPVGDVDRRRCSRRRRRTRVRDRRRRGAKTLATVEHLAAAGSPHRAAPRRRGRRPSAAGWSATPPGSPPPCTTAASPWCRCRPRCSRWSTPRSAARPGSTCPRARTSSARSGSRPACSATSTRSPRCRRGSTAAASARWRSTTSSPATTSTRCRSPSGSPAASRSRPTSSPPTSARAGRRALLNYGHTLAHALEIATRARPHPRRGGRVGLVFAAELARRARAHRRRPASPSTATVVGETYGLPTAIPARLDPDELLALMGRDKKALDGLTFVLDGPRGIEVVAGSRPRGRPQRALRESPEERASVPSVNAPAPIVLLLTGRT